MKRNIEWFSLWSHFVKYLEISEWALEIMKFWLRDDFFTCLPTLWCQILVLYFTILCHIWFLFWCKLNWKIQADYSPLYSIFCHGYDRSISLAHICRYQNQTLNLGTFICSQILKPLKINSTTLLFDERLSQTQPQSYFNGCVETTLRKASNSEKVCLNLFAYDSTPVHCNYLLCDPT